MKKGVFSQEGLKLIAAMAMLLDHFGATVVYSAYMDAVITGNPAAANRLVGLYYCLRILGRIAFPIYCFQLVEGFHHTRDLKKYVKRLAVGLVLSEIPFDLAFSGGLDWSSSSVMVTLLLGVLMMAGMETFRDWRKLLAIPPFMFLAELLGSDYGGNGIALIAILYLTRGIPHEKLWRTAAMTVLLWFGITVSVFGLEIPLELFGLVSLVPIFLYDGRKVTKSKWVQWAFYLFYPVHILLLWAVDRLLFGVVPV